VLRGGAYACISGQAWVKQKKKKERHKKRKEGEGTHKDYDRNETQTPNRSTYSSFPNY
jgi:hypothetical protein